MKNYMYISVECYSYIAMLDVYENKYKADYQLIGYEHDSNKQCGVLVLYKKRGEKQ